MGNMKNGYRVCNKCSITSDVIPFYKSKDSKTGKIYEHCICIMCRKDIQSITRRKYYLKHRKQQIKDAAKWNKENREQYNQRRRIENKFFRQCCTA